jgi:hypothetical protein
VVLNRKSSKRYPEKTADELLQERLNAIGLGDEDDDEILAY